MTGTTQRIEGLSHRPSRRGWLRWMGVAALAGALALGSVVPTTAWAGPNQPVRYAPNQATAAQGKATLNVVVVKADKSGKVDPALKNLERQLSFSGFTGFQVVNRESLKLGKGQSDTVPGGAGYKLKTELLGHDGEKARVRVQILKGSQTRVDTTVRIPKGKAFTVKGPKVNNGAMIYVINYRS